MSLVSERSNPSASRLSGCSKRTVAIDEDFYNSIGRAYSSGEDDDSDGAYDDDGGISTENLGQWSSIKGGDTAGARAPETTLSKASSIAVAAATNPSRMGSTSERTTQNDAAHNGKHSLYTTGQSNLHEPYRKVPANPEAPPTAFVSDLEPQAALSCAGPLVGAIASCEARSAPDAMDDAEQGVGGSDMVLERRTCLQQQEQPMEIEESCPRKSFGLEDRIDKARISGSNDGDSSYHGSISTASSINKDRGVEVPRLWICDRVDGTVCVSDEEQQRFPERDTRPPCFLCLPSPILTIFPWLLEENLFCVTVGKFGFFGRGYRGEAPSRHGKTIQSTTADESDAVDIDVGFFRTRFLMHNLRLNLCGFLVTVLATVALTKSSAGLLELASFGRTNLNPDSNYKEEAGSVASSPVNLYMGLLAMGIDNPNGIENGSSRRTKVVPFQDFCTTQGIDQFLPEDDCHKCAQISVWIIVGFVVILLSYIPTFTTGTLRLYEHYDMNCSKVWAGFWSFLGLVGYAVVLYCYSGVCLESLYHGEMIYTGGREVYTSDQFESIAGDPDERIIRVTFEWKMGIGQVLFLVGFALKAVDFVANCCIATPAITRSRSAQWDYEDLSLLTKKNAEVP